ncbi:unnamed protein product [Colias eurytheme]|nr:unnamed protein product [Colias eurytheme]
MYDSNERYLSALVVYETVSEWEPACDMGWALSGLPLCGCRSNFCWLITCHENLAPSELKKLRNKQRKAKRKAEQESALAAQVQGCVEVLESLRNGDFGPCDKEIEEYIEACRKKFPYAIAFKPPSPQEPDHVDETPLQPKEININN